MGVDVNVCQHEPSGLEDIVGVFCGCGTPHSRKEQCAKCGERVLWHDFPGRGEAVPLALPEDRPAGIETLRRMIAFGAAAARLKFGNLYDFTGYGPFVMTDEQIAAMGEKWEKR